MMNFDNKNKLLLFAILAALLGSVADVLLLYNPEGNYHLGDYQFFHDISKGRLISGYYLGILFIGFELLGFWVITKAVFPNQKNTHRLFFTALCFLFLLGIIYHAAISFIGVFIKEIDNGLNIVNQYQLMFRPLEIIMGLFLIIITFFIVSRIYKGKTLLPKWVLFFNPVLVYGILILLYFTIPPIGNFLIVAGFNISNGLFIAACTYALWNKSVT